MNRPDKAPQEISNKSKKLAEETLPANLQKNDFEALRTLQRKLTVEEVWIKQQIDQQPQNEQLTQYRGLVAQAKDAVKEELDKREKAKTSAVDGKKRRGWGLFSRDKNAPATITVATRDLPEARVNPVTDYYRQRNEAELAEQSLSPRTTTTAVS